MQHLATGGTDGTKDMGITTVTMAGITAIATIADRKQKIVNKTQHTGCPNSSFIFKQTKQKQYSYVQQTIMRNRTWILRLRTNARSRRMGRPLASSHGTALWRRVSPGAGKYRRNGQQF
jgi:hypothetical protein